MKANSSTSLAERLYAAANAYPDREALWVKGETISYDVLYAEASRIADSLLQSGVKKGDRVAILSSRSFVMYEAVFACVLVGAVYTPLNSNFPYDRNSSMLNAAEARAMIVDQDQIKQAAKLCSDANQPLCVLLPNGSSLQFDKTLQVVDQSAIASASSCVKPAVIDPEDLCYLLFTSGSTGTPKGVPITHGNVTAYLDGIAQLTLPTPQDKIAQVVDLTFDLSAHDIFLTWTHGAALYSIPENAAGLAHRFVVDYELTGWLSVPSTAALALQMGQLTVGSMPSLRFSYFCGEALADVVAVAWLKAAPNSAVTNIYGPTEATIAFSYYHFNDSLKNRPAIVPIGVPLLAQEMCIFDRNYQRVDAGESGELFLSGSQLSPGYWHAPELSEDKFVMINGQRWYQTGDRARYDEEEGFHYISRVDHQIKLQGFRVELAEIESVLREVCAQTLLAVVAEPANLQGIVPGVVAYITGLEVDKNILDKALRQRLPHYMIPKSYRFLKELPLNINGKINYRVLTEWVEIEAAK